MCITLQMTCYDDNLKNLKIIIKYSHRQQQQTHTHTWKQFINNI